MAINIKHTYSTRVDIHYYSDDDYTLHGRDCGEMDSIAERVCEVLIKHNFPSADVFSTATGELLMRIERS